MIHFKSKLVTLFLLFTLAICNGVQDGCTINQFSQVSDITSRCTSITISNLKVPGGKTLKLDLQTGSKLTFQGTTTFDVANWDGFLVEFSGENIKVDAEPGSVLNAKGDQYWDGQGTSGGVTKPKFIKITTQSSSFRNINLLNCPQHCVEIHSTTSLLIDGWNIDVSAGNTKGKNTNGFGIGDSTNVLIQNSVIKNQDDCVVVYSGSNMLIGNLKCYGSHGLSLSVGSDEADDDDTQYGRIENIFFLDSLVANGLYGIHVKTKYGKGSLSNILYSNIELSGISKDGIYINQDYGSPGNLDRDFEISNLNVINIQGSVKGSATPLHVVCNKGKCSNWQWANIKISGGGKDVCNYSPPPAYVC